MLSSKRKLEIENDIGRAMDILNIINKSGIKRPTIYGNTLLTYLSTTNLIKQSKRLTWLTIALIATSVGMIGLAITQLIVLYVSKN